MTFLIKHLQRNSTEVKSAPFHCPLTIKNPQWQHQGSLAFPVANSCSLSLRLYREAFSSYLYYIPAHNVALVMYSRLLHFSPEWRAAEVSYVLARLYSNARALVLALSCQCSGQSEILNERRMLERRE